MPRAAVSIQFLRKEWVLWPSTRGTQHLQSVQVPVYTHSLGSQRRHLRLSLCSGAQQLDLLLRLGGVVPHGEACGLRV